jgi:hypothetical protein
VILHNDRLEVEIADLGTAYQGARFDWTGFITQVTLDQTHTFCAPESLRAGEGTGGIGLCNEFGIMKPIGYDDARPGEQFPKLGVGLLTKPDDAAHEFFRPYRIEPFAVRIKPEADRVVYDIEPLPCRGYEARLRKTVQLHDAAFDVVYELENVGARAIRTHEYNHNFIAIDGRPPGPGDLLRLAKDVALADVPPLLSIEGRDVRWRDKTPVPFLCPAPGPYPQIDGPFWELTYEPGGVGMRETVNVPAEHFGLWCTPHLVGPEVFVTIDLQPGARMTWTRRYGFFTNATCH